MQNIQVIFVITPRVMMKRFLGFLVRSSFFMPYGSTIQIVEKNISRVFRRYFV